MSQTLEQNKSDSNAPIDNTSFSGGVFRGRCIQMNQPTLGGKVNTIQMTKEQVIKQIAIMSNWLAE